MKTIITGTVIDPILDCGHAEMEIEACIRNGSPIYQAELQSELLEYEGKRVMITIEELG